MKRARIADTVVSSTRPAWLMAAVVFVGLFLAVLPVLAADDGPTLTISPDALHLREDQTARALVILRNTSGDALADVRVSITTTAGTACLITGVSSPSATCANEGATQPAAVGVAAGADARWTLRLEGADASRAVQVEVTAEFVSVSGARRTPRILTAQIELAAAEATATPAPTATPSEPPALASASVNGAALSLAEDKSGALYVTVQNTSKDTITIVSIVPSVPADSVTIMPDTRIDTAAIGPGEERTYPFVVKAKNSITPGNEVVVFEITAEGGGRVYSSVISKDLALGVLGESGLATLLGFPLLIIAPGFSFLAAFLSVLKMGGRTVAWSDTDKRVWLLSLPLSLLLVAIYGGITGHDVLAAYNLKDIASILTIALVAGAVLAIAVISVMWLVREFLRRRAEFSTSDSPLTALRKLRRRGLTLALPKATWTGLATGEFVFATTDGPLPPSGDLWVLPPILVTYPAGADARVQGNKELVRALLVQTGDLDALARRLDEAADLGASVAWKQGSVFRPLSRSVAGMSLGAKDLVVSVVPDS